MSLQPTQECTVDPLVESVHMSVEHTNEKLLVSLLALTIDRIEADEIELQRVLWHLMQRLQHVTLSVFSDAITTADNGNLFVPGIL